MGVHQSAAAAVAMALAVSSTSAADTQIGRPFKPYVSWELPLGESTGIVDYAFDAKNMVALLQDSTEAGGQLLFVRMNLKGKIDLQGSLTLPDGASGPTLAGVSGDVILVKAVSTAVDGASSTIFATYMLSRSHEKNGATGTAELIGQLLLPDSANMRREAALFTDGVQLETRSWDTTAGTTTCETLIYDVKLKKILRRLDASGPDAWTEALPSAEAPKLRASRTLDISEDWSTGKAVIQLYK